MSKNHIKKYVEDNLKNGYSLNQIESVLASTYSKDEYEQITKSYDQTCKKISIKDEVNFLLKHFINISILSIACASILWTVVTLGMGAGYTIPFILLGLGLYYFSDRDKSYVALIGFIICLLFAILFLTIFIQLMFIW